MPNFPSFRDGVALGPFLEEKFGIPVFINNDGERVVIPPCPIKVWQGTDDKTVDPVMVEEYVNSIRRSGSYVEFHKLEGVGHRANDAMRKELLMWFNRFV